MNKEEILKLRLKDLSEYRNIYQCAKDLGYLQTANTRERIHKLNLGFNLESLGLKAFKKNVWVLSPEEFEILKKDMGYKRPPGRKKVQVN